jgi:hypothetical protein
MRLALVLLLSASVAAPAFAERVFASPAEKALYDAEIADQNRRSEALNAEVNRRNAEIDARNAAARAAHERAVADHRRAVEAQDAATALARAGYLEAMERWRIAVTACKAGDTKACRPAS